MCQEKDSNAKHGRIVQQNNNRTYEKNNGEIWTSKIDLDYAYGQAKLSKKAAKHCGFSIIGGDFTGCYRFKKRFYGVSVIPTVFQEHIDKVLKFKTPV